MSINQLYYSLSILGFILAQFVCLVFSGRFEGDRADRSLIFELGQFGIHFHHWMYGLIILILLIVVEQYTGRHWLISVSKGFSLGLVFHGIMFYTDYFGIVKKL